MTIVTKDNIEQIRQEHGLNTFILMRKMKVNGKFNTYYHEKLELNKNNQVMNVYIEHVDSDITKALTFYNVDEAMRMGAFLQSDVMSESIVIKTNK